MVHGLRYTVKSAVPGNVVFSGSAGGRVGVCFCACEDIEVFRLRDNFFMRRVIFIQVTIFWAGGVKNVSFFRRKSMTHRCCLKVNPL